MPKKYAKKISRPRRRLQKGGAFAKPYPSANKVISDLIRENAGPIAKSAYSRYQQARSTKTVSPRQARANYLNRLETSDNITTAKAVVIGTQTTPSFQEKVANAVRPPLTFKRNYQFSAECLSGRKAMFAMTINSMTSDDLLTDITAYKSAMATDTSSADATLAANSFSDNAQFYIDYHKERIKMINSSSNSITGKIHLFQHKRDTDTAYDSALINPINLMMYYSATARSLISSGAGGEQTLGNGWFFNSSGGATGYNSIFNMPGSSINASGSTASVDPMLSPTSSFISDRVGFWFKKVSTSDFSLKPGQQFNSSYVFNLDNNKIHRELQEFTHIAGISYCLVVEFVGGIVGDSTALSTTVSTGTCQLSVIRENQRMIGLENKLKRKIVLQTAPLTAVADAAQQIINSDSGVQDVGVEYDTA